MPPCTVREEVAEDSVSPLLQVLSEKRLKVREDSSVSVTSFVVSLKGIVTSLAPGDVILKLLAVPPLASFVAVHVKVTVSQSLYVE